MSRVIMVQINASLNQNVTRVRKLGLFLSSIALAVSVSARTEDKDLMDKLILDPSLKTFTNLIVKAGLIETLKAEGPLTIFAPNDAAFARMPSAILEGLKKDKVLLRKALSYHIYNGKVLSKDLKDGSLKMQSGDLIVIKVKLGLPLTVNGRSILTPDIETSNGVIHVISTIMTPPSKLSKTP
jgi:uncharacterized surface protein with fasciclin (FAS1) repeats